jgi:hypothetical protein
VYNSGSTGFAGGVKRAIGVEGDSVRALKGIRNDALATLARAST